jgi:hypothetical protein
MSITPNLSYGISRLLPGPRLRSEDLILLDIPTPQLHFHKQVLRILILLRLNQDSNKYVI